MKEEITMKVKTKFWGIFDKILNKKTAMFVMAVSALLLAITGFCPGSTSDIGGMVEIAINVVMGVVAFGGVINIIRGIATVAKGLQDDGGGQDAAAISKGRGQLIAGIIMVAPVAIFTIIAGQAPGAYVKSFFT